MDYIVVARLRVSADTSEQAKEFAKAVVLAGTEWGQKFELIAIEPPRAEPDLADMARRTLMAGFTS